MKPTPKNNTKNQSSKEKVKMHLRIVIYKIRRASASILYYLYDHIRPDNRQTERTNEEKERISEKTNRLFQNWGVMLNLVMIIVFALSIWYQGNLTQRSLSKTDLAIEVAQNSDIHTRIISDTNSKQFRQTIELAKRSLDFTKASDSASEIFRKIELRAYVSIKEIKNIDILKEKIFNAGVFMENTGRTPAIKARLVWGLKKYRKCLYDADFEMLRKIDTTSGENLHPGIPQLIEIQSPGWNISSLDSTWIVKQEFYLFIFGYIFYDDIFGDSHENKFALIYDPEAKSFYYKDIKDPEK